MSIANRILGLIIGLAITAAAYAQSRPELQPGAGLRLPCPPMRYFADPQLDVRVSPSDAGAGAFLYTYRISFNERLPKRPLSQIRIEGMTQTELDHWQGDFRSCRIMGYPEEKQTLSCRAKLEPAAKRGANRKATVVLKSSRAPGVGRYSTRTVVTPADVLLTPENRSEWLPYFDHSDYLLTESLQEQLMEQCSSALIVKNDQRAMTGAVTVPFYADAEPRAMAARERIQPEDLTKALDRLIGDLKNELPEMAYAGNEPRIAVKDSTGRWVTSDPQSELDWDTLYPGPPGTAAKVDLGEIKTACNIRAVFVEILPPDLAIGEQAASAAAERIAVRDYMPLERRAIEIDPSRPCEPLEETFEFTLPEYEKRR